MNDIKFFEAYATLERGFAYIEDGPKHPCYYRRIDSWNGWGCPFFDKTQAQRIVDQYNDINSGCTAEWIGQSIKITFLDDSAEPEVFDPVQVSDSLTLWAIGAWSWTWDIDAPEDNPEMTLIQLAMELGGVISDAGAREWLGSNINDALEAWEKGLNKYYGT